MADEGRTTSCPHGDPTCPCQDGDPCHYEPFEDIRHDPAGADSIQINNPRRQHDDRRSPEH